MNFMLLIPLILLTQTLHCMEKVKPIAAAASSSSSTNTIHSQVNPRAVVANQQPHKEPLVSKEPLIPAEIDESSKKKHSNGQAPDADRQQRVIDTLERIACGREAPKFVCKWEKLEIDKISVPGGIPREIRDCIDSFKLGKQGRGIILYGPPGVGKTTYAARIGAETERLFTRISSSDFQTVWKASGQKSVRELFDQAEQQGVPVIMLIEEIDGAANEEYKNAPDVEQTCYALLFEIDRVKSNKNIFVILTSNHFHKLPATLKSRLENIYIPLPDWAERQIILTSLFRAKNISVSEMSRKLADKTEGRSRRDLENFVNKADQQLWLRLQRAGNRANRAELELQHIDCALADSKFKMETAERCGLLRHWISEHTCQGMESKIEHGVTDAIPESLEQIWLAFINSLLRIVAIKHSSTVIQLAKNKLAPLNLPLRTVEPNSIQELLLQTKAESDSIEEQLLERFFDADVFKYIVCRYKVTKYGFQELITPSNIAMSRLINNLIMQYLNTITYENFRFVGVQEETQASFSSKLRSLIILFEEMTQVAEESIKQNEKESASAPASAAQVSAPAQTLPGNNTLPAVLEKIILHNINTVMAQSNFRFTKRGVSLNTQEYADIRPAFDKNCEVFNYVAQHLVAAQLDPSDKSLARVNWLLVIKYLRNANFTNDCSLQKLDGTALSAEEATVLVKKMILRLALSFSVHHKHYLKSTVTGETIQQIAELTANCTSDQLERIVNAAANYAVKYQEIELRDIHMLMGLYEVVAEVRADADIRKRILAYLLREYVVESAIPAIAGDLAAAAEEFSLGQLEDVIRRGHEWAATNPTFKRGSFKFFVGLYLGHRDMAREHLITVKYRTEKSADIYNLEYTELQEEMPIGKIQWPNREEIAAALIYELSLPGIQHTISEKFIWSFARAYSRKEKPDDLGIYEDCPRVSCYGIMRIVQEAKKIAHERNGNDVINEDNFSKAAWNYCQFTFGSYDHNLVASVALSGAHVVTSAPVNMLRNGANVVNDGINFLLDKFL